MLVKMISEQEFNEKKAEGWFYCRIILQVVGRPIDYVNKTLNDYVNKINVSENYKLYKKTVNSAEKLSAQEDIEKVGELYSAFAELEILFKNVMEVINFSFDYMPSSIEIIEPTTLVIKNNHLTSFINDLLGKLHELNYIVKNNEQDKQQLLKNQQIIVRNLVIVALSSGPKDTNVLSQLAGLPKEYLKPIIDNLLKEELITENNGIYKLKRQ